MCIDDDRETSEPFCDNWESPCSSYGPDYRRDLLLSNRERIEFTYDQAIAKGLDSPIILVLDLFDSRAVWMAQMVGAAWHHIERCRADCRDLDLVPVHVAAVPFCTALRLVGPTTSNSPHGIAKPCPSGTFRVVAIAGGGNSFADFPVPPVAEI